MKRKFKIDLNLDAGESPEALADGSEEKLYQLVTSVNIACGGHAGDENTMAQALKLAQKYQLKIGAHPSFPDRENFGRKVLQIPQQQLIDSLAEQIENLKSVCRKLGCTLTHVKPHGALYNLAATDFSAAEATIKTVLQVDSSLAVVGLAGSNFRTWCQQAGLKFISEAFVDRRYESDGRLRDRKYSDALIREPALAAQQALQIVNEGSITAVDGTRVPIQTETLCIHGDSPEALAIARAVHSILEKS